MARSRRLPQVGRSLTPRRQSVPPAPAPAPGKSQGPAHGQGFGIGLYLLSTGTVPGRILSGGGGGAGFPTTGVLDSFTRADSGSLGANWTKLNPGGLDGYTVTDIGIAGNAAYDPDTSVPNKASAAWNPSTFAGQSEAYFTVAQPFGDWVRVALRAQNLNSGTVKYYMAGMNGTSWGIVRQDTQAAETSLTSGSTAALVAGNKIGGRVYTNAAGNVVIDFWVYRAASGWVQIGTVTDSSASKITAAGYIGMILGNAAGSSTGRADDFGGGTF